MNELEILSLDFHKIFLSQSIILCEFYNNGNCFNIIETISKVINVTNWKNNDIIIINCTVFNMIVGNAVGYWTYLTIP